jgi:hypothetical protein
MEFDLMDRFFSGGNKANTMEINLDVDDIPFIEGKYSMGRRTSH